MKHHEDVDHATIQKYARVLSKCIAFALAIHLNTQAACAHYTFALPPPIISALDDLISNYRQVEPPAIDIDTGTAPIDTDVAHFDDDGEHYVAPDYRHKKKVYVFAQPSAVIQPRLSRVIESFFQQLPPDGYNSSVTFFSLVVRFLIVSCLSENGDFCSSSAVTQTIAALTFSGRVTMHNLLLREVGLNPTADRSRCVSTFPSCCVILNGTHPEL